MNAQKYQNLMFFGNLRIFLSDYFPLKAITIRGHSQFSTSATSYNRRSQKLLAIDVDEKKNHTRSVISGKHHKNCTTRKYWNCKRWKKSKLCVHIFLLKWNAPTSGAISPTLRFISELLLSYAVLFRFSRQTCRHFIRSSSLIDFTVLRHEPCHARSSVSGNSRLFWSLFQPVHVCSMSHSPSKPQRLHCINAVYIW